MIFDSIKRNIFAIVISCLAIVLVLWGNNLLLPKREVIIPYNPMPLMQLLLNLFYKDFWITVILGGLMILILAILLFRLNEIHLFLTKHEPLLAILFVVLMSTFVSTQYLLSVHFALFFIILSLNCVFRTYRLDYAFSEIFIGSVYLSIATLFYAPSIYFLPVLIICLSLMKPVLWRDCVVVIAGLGVPYLFALFYYYFVWSDFQIPFILFIDNIQFTVPYSLSVFSITEWIYLIYIAVLMLLLIMRFIFTPAVGNKIKTIRINIVFIWMFFISLLCSIFYSQQSSRENLLLMSLPLSVLLANFFSTIRSNRLANVILILLFLSAFAIQIPDSCYVSIGDFFNYIWEFIVELF